MKIEEERGRRKEQNGEQTAGKCTSTAQEADYCQSILEGRAIWQ